MARIKASYELERAKLGAADNRLQQRGGFFRLSHDSFKTGGAGAGVGQILDPSGAGETGLFTPPGSGIWSQDSDKAVGGASWNVIMRDITEGPPPVGSASDKYCTKHVLLAGRGVYNEAAIEQGGDSTEWERPVRSGSSLVGIDSWIGPVACSYGN